MILINDAPNNTVVGCSECEARYRRYDLPHDETYDAEMLKFLERCETEHVCAEKPLVHRLIDHRYSGTIVCTACNRIVWNPPFGKIECKGCGRDDAWVIYEPGV